MSRMPTLFVSHGAPTFALSPGRAGPQLTELGRALPPPAAVLVVSPHWMTPDLRVGTSALPATIHDFGGFDPRHYQLSYPALGHPVLARRTIEVLAKAGWTAQADEFRGLDHGAWVPLLHLFPAAKVPVFQVSLPLSLDADRAWDLGQALAPLAEEVRPLIVETPRLSYPGRFPLRITARDEAGTFSIVREIEFVGPDRAATGDAVP